MYTNRKLIANQSVAEREKFYCEKAYEYTLRADTKALYSIAGRNKKNTNRIQVFSENLHTVHCRFWIAYLFN